jgi:hypothetical protein
LATTPSSLSLRPFCRAPRLTPPPPPPSSPPHPSCDAQQQHDRAAQRDAWERQERERLAKEEDERKTAELKKIESKLEKERMEALLAQAGEAQVDLAKLAAKHLDQAALQRALNEKLLKAKDEETRKRAEQARRVDYLVRAIRETERPKLETLLRSTLDGDAAYVAKFNADNLASRRSTFDVATAMKSKITRILPYARTFEEGVKAKREEAYLTQKVRRRRRSISVPNGTRTRTRPPLRSHAHTRTPASVKSSCSASSAGVSN